MATETYGFTETGFVPKRAAQILYDMKIKLAQVQNEDGEYPFLEETDDSLLSQLAGIFANELAVCWSALGDVYVQFDPLYNTGAGQSATVQLNGLERKAGSYSTLTVTCTGTAGTIIPKGSLISNFENTLSYAIDNETEIGENGTINTTATCTQLGYKEVPNNTINFIKSAVSGWNSVTNIKQNNTGTDEETDAELRARQQVSTQLTSYRQVGAIYAGIMQVEGVQFCRVYVNSTWDTDERGIPPKEIACVVKGGDDTEIAKVIFNRAPVTIEGYGNTAVTLKDLQNISHTIQFIRPVEKAIDIYVKIKMTDTNTFPSTYEDDIKAAIVDYIVNGDGTTQGLVPGDDFYVSRFYTPINTIAGFEVLELKAKLSTSDTYTTENIPIGWNELATVSEDNITVILEDEGA